VNVSQLKLRSEKFDNNNNNNNKQETSVSLDKNRWYAHVPKSLETAQGCKATILWNQQVQTDRNIPNNKPDIIIRVNGKRTCMLIDVAISGNRNVIKKEAEKF
jgi:hypothetical protein